MELRYLGVPMSEISEEINIPYDTIRGWFEKNGRLFPVYEDFKLKMAQIKERRLEDLFETDENLALLTTNIMRRYGKNLQENKENPNVSDVVSAWKVQRVMQDKPTEVSKSVVKDEGNLTQEDLDQMFNELGYVPRRENKNTDEGTMQGHREVREGDVPTADSTTTSEQATEQNEPGDA